MGPQDPNLRKKTKTRTLQPLTDEEEPPTHASRGLKGLKPTCPGDPVGSRSLLPHPPQTDTTASETHLPAAVGVCQHTSSPGGPGSPGFAVTSSRRSASPLPGLKSEMLLGPHGPSSPADPSQAQPCLHPSPDKERPRPLPGGSVRGTLGSLGHCGLASHGPGLPPRGLDTSHQPPPPQQHGRWGSSVTQAETTTPHSTARCL